MSVDQDSNSSPLNQESRAKPPSHSSIPSFLKKSYSSHQNLNPTESPQAQQENSEAITRGITSISVPRGLRVACKASPSSSKRKVGAYGSSFNYSGCGGRRYRKNVPGNNTLAPSFRREAFLSFLSSL